MPSVMEPPEPGTFQASTAPPQLPDATVLADKTPLWFRTSAVSALFTLVIGLVFVVMASRPLWHTDLWDHLSYGRDILEHQRIAATEPLLKLAQGMPMVNIPWLAQVGMTALLQHFGLPSLQFVYGLLIAGCLALIAHRTVVRSGAASAGLIACAVFLALNYHQLMIIRPQLAGLLFYCGVAAWSAGMPKHLRWAWIGMPIMFAAWSNIHASFSTGLLLLALTTAGRVCDIIARSGSVVAAIRAPHVVRLVLLTEICAAAVLLNPHGLAVYPEVLQVAAHPNIESMFEWSPLTLRMNQGQWACGVTFLLLTALKLTPRRVRFTEILPLLVMGLLTLWSARMINWFAPLAAIITSVHLAAVVRRYIGRSRPTQLRAVSGLWTVVCLGLCWVMFACTTLGIQVVHGRTTRSERMLSRETPLQLAEFLNSAGQLPPGISFVPAEWAGFLMYSVPDRLLPMVNLHVHVIPQEVWDDYLKILNGPGDWDALLDQYGVNLVIADRNRQPGLIRRISESEAWTILYQDQQALVLTRNEPIP